MSTPKILAISGSLREKSLNTASLRVIQGLAGDRADVTIYSLKDIPLYNGDLDTDEGVPAVNDLKAAIEEADAVIFATPEYNYSITGVLKNAIDWASRPAFQSCLKDKPIGIVSASMAFTGGVRAQSTLKYILSGTLSNVLPAHECVIAAAHTKFDADGNITDDVTRDHLGKVLDTILAHLAA